MRALSVVALLLAFEGSAHADAAPDRMARLVGLADLWIEARVTHPATLRGDVDLDAAAVAAIPKVEAATTKAAYQAALQGMLAVFKDPATRVEDPAAAPAPPRVPASWIERPLPKLVVVTFAALAAPAHAGKQGELIAALPAELAGAEIVVFDVRAPGVVNIGDFVDNASSALPVVEKWPLSRRVVHHGFRSHDGWASGKYDSVYAQSPVIVTQRGRAGVKHVVLVTDARSAIPFVVLGLQASGLATIVSSDPLDDTRVARTSLVSLPYGLRAEIRNEQVTMPDDTAIAADVIVKAPASPHHAAVELAKKLVQGAAPPPRKSGRTVAAPAPALRDDADWPASPFPSRDLRVFAAIRAWGILSRFFPYLDLVKDWDARLPIAIAEVEAATNAKQYRDALSRLGAYLRDGHVWVHQKPRPPTGAPALELRLVEGRPVVTDAWDQGALATGVLRLGDEVLSIDGVAIDKLRDQQRPLTSGGTAAALENNVLKMIASGPVAQAVTLELRGADRKARTVQLPRDLPPPVRTAPHFKVVPGNIGYADLRVLTVDEVDAMFQAFVLTRAIIFDLRGYPKGTAWPIAPYLNVKRASYGAEVLQPLVRASDVASERTTFYQPLPYDPSKVLYKGKVAVLIDDRAVSQSEHSCLFFENAADITFIGTPTHGTNGDITVMRLPGGLRMTFTGQAIRHVDGRRLQQVGIQPTIEIAPTIAGIRAGKDEVLERAIQWATKSR